MRTTRSLIDFVCRAVAWMALLLLVGLVLFGSCTQPFSRRSRPAQVAATRAQIAMFKDALSLYIENNGRPPTTEQGLGALLVAPQSEPLPRKWRGPYVADVTEIPLDPWGNEYLYSSPGPHGNAFLIVSLGADGRRGGDGYDGDVTSVDPE
jgi:general secretion pathway protein G